VEIILFNMVLFLRQALESAMGIELFCQVLERFCVLLSLYCLLRCTTENS